jgi:DNA modification methylase
VDDFIPATILDPFCGTATTLLQAREMGYSAIGCELNPDYVKLAEARLADKGGLFA